MLTQKTFHLPMPWRVARARLANFRDYCRECEPLEEAVVRLPFRLPFNFHGYLDLVPVAGRNPTQLLFRSEGGPIRLIGLMEYFEVGPNLTEIVLTIDYVIASPFRRCLDYFTGGVEYFLNGQLALIEAHFDPGGQRR